MSGRKVAEGSIRLGILKAKSSENSLTSRPLVAEGSIRLGILKESPLVRSARLSDVAEGSIRLGILKVNPDGCVGAAQVGCRGLDPIGDTERPITPPQPCRHLRLQRARSDWGYLSLIHI